MIDPVVDKITYQIAYGPSDWLAEFGGSLGLWLGLSLVGILEMVHFGWGKFRNICPKLYENSCQKKGDDSVTINIFGHVGHLYNGWSSSGPQNWLQRNFTIT